MNLIDMHCDTLWKLLGGDPDWDMNNNPCTVSVEYLKKAQSCAQFFACFIYMEDFLGPSRYEQAYEYAHQVLVRLKREVKRYDNDLALAYDYESFQRNWEEGKISAIATIEEGGIVHDETDRIDELYAAGIRLITLLWNHENCMGYPNSKDIRIMNAGLKPFGFDTIDKMNELGMIIDVSHMSDGGFWDTVQYSKVPVAASHSNARAIRNHPRNLSDEMIRALAETGGVAGLNFYQQFLGESKDSRIAEMTAHILHMMHVGGEDAVCIGTDFDGFDYEGVMEIPNIGAMELLSNALKKAGVTERQLDKIWSGNVIRVMKEVC